MYPGGNQEVGSDLITSAMDSQSESERHPEKSAAEIQAEITLRKGKTEAIVAAGCVVAIATVFAPELVVGAIARAPKISMISRELSFGEATGMTLAGTAAGVNALTRVPAQSAPKVLGPNAVGKAGEAAVRAGRSLGATRTVLSKASKAYKGSTLVGHALSKPAGRNPADLGCRDGGSPLGMLN